MKLHSHRRLILSGTMLLLTTVLLIVNSWKKERNQQVSSFLRKPSGQPLTVVEMQAKKLKKKDVLSTKKALEARSIVLGRSSPTHVSWNQLSDEELAEFPKARVVDSIEIPGPEANQVTHVKILQTDFKYPYIRTEEVVDADSGERIRREEMIADHLLVRLAPGENAQDFLKKFGSSATSIASVTPDAPLYRLQLASASLDSLPQALEKIAADGGAPIRANPDFMGHLCTTPNDPSVQWYSDFAYWTQNFLPFMQGYADEFQWGLFKIQAPEAWESRNSAPSVIVGVIDSGIRYTHQDLKANMWHNPAPTNNDIYGWNAYGQNGVPNGDPMDKVGHGTFCAGIIGAAGNNGIGITGVAWKVQLMACRCTDDQGNVVDSDAVSCIDYACDHGAKVLNCSFTGASYSQDQYDAFQRAQQQGVIVITAAGNGAKNGRPINLEQEPVYPACYLLDNIMCVAATDFNDEIANFSNYGPMKVQIAAPGVDIYSTWGGSLKNPDISDITGSGDACYGNGGGTSAAAPFVTGSLALMMAQFPNDPYRLVMDKLLAAADKVPALDGKVGYGRLNLARALAVIPKSALRPLTIDLVTVGDVGNCSDSSNKANGIEYGSVDEPYQIGTDCITAAQYSEFLNAVATVSDSYHLYDERMSSDSAVACITRLINKSGTREKYHYVPIKGAEQIPITYVSWQSAARFCNWLQNGQPSGNEDTSTTETGAYLLNGTMNAIVAADQKAQWFLPTENQWYKAAYYKSAGINSGYWNYPTQADQAPGNQIGSDPNQANYKKEGQYCVISWSTKNRLASIQSFTGSQSAYGTYDMGGNVFQWVDATRDAFLPSDQQVVRGGAWSSDFNDLEASTRKSFTASSGTNFIGFRVASKALLATPTSTTSTTTEPTASTSPTGNPMTTLNGTSSPTPTVTPIPGSGVSPTTVVAPTSNPTPIAERPLPPWPMEMVTVGDPGNEADPRSGFGAVDTSYQIGKYPVTANQYCTFLNAVAVTDTYGLYTEALEDGIGDDLMVGSIIRSGSSGSYYYSVKPGWEDEPIVFMDRFKAARFCNWMHNGCLSGDEGPNTTENGAYDLNGATDGDLVPVNSNAAWFLPTGDQWYKAACYKGGGMNADYWQYCSGSDSMPGNIIGDEPNQANIPSGRVFATTGTSYSFSWLTPVGIFTGTPGPYGTYDMAGNAEEIIDIWPAHLNVSTMGGSFLCDFYLGEGALHISPEPEGTGFRIAAPITTVSENYIPSTSASSSATPASAN